MAVILALAAQGAQMLLVLVLAPLLTGFIRKLKARAPPRAANPAAISRPFAAHAPEVSKIADGYQVRRVDPARISA